MLIFTVCFIFFLFNYVVTCWTYLVPPGAILTTTLGTTQPLCSSLALSFTPRFSSACKVFPLVSN